MIYIVVDFLAVSFSRCIFSYNAGIIDGRMYLFYKLSVPRVSKT